MSKHATLGSVTITMHDTADLYTPKPGDIIEKGRFRIEYRSDDDCPVYRRSRLTGEWYNVAWLDISQGVIAIMVRCDGWRLVYRTEAP